MSTRSILTVELDLSDIGEGFSIEDVIRDEVLACTRNLVRAEFNKLQQAYGKQIKKAITTAIMAEHPEWNIVDVN